MPYPGQVPYYAKGKEPLPPGADESMRDDMAQQEKMTKFMEMGMESCVVKSGIAGVGGFAIGGFISLMNSAFIYEDPVLRANREAALGKPIVAERARDVLKNMGKGIWTSGRGFAKVGALFAGIECCIEGVRSFTMSPEELSLILTSSTAAKTISTTPLPQVSLRAASSRETQAQKPCSGVVLPSLFSQLLSTTLSYVGKHQSQSISCVLHCLLLISTQGGLIVSSHAIP